MERVIISLQIGGDAVTKIWRFDVSRIRNYTQKSVEEDLVRLFPDIASKKLKLRMWYFDDLAGKVSVAN